MLGLLAQASYDYSYDVTTTNANEGAFAALGAMMGVFLLIGLVIAVIQIAGMWKIFEKAGVAGWKAIIPIYNTWLLAEISGRPGWWGLAPLLGIVPYIGGLAAAVVMIIIYIDLVKAFGKETIWVLLLIFLPVVGFPMLGFGDAKYTKPSGASPAKPAATA
jgi:hypothetical protein